MTEPRLAPYQLTRDEVIECAKSRAWEALAPTERALLQLRQDRLLMDFSAFHAGMTELLGRSVYSHEFADPDALWQEYLGLLEKPSFSEIIDKLPKHLRVDIIAVFPND